MTALSISRAASLGLVGLALAGCGKQTSSRPKTGHGLPPAPLVSKGQPGQFGGRFVIAIAGSPKTFNPLFALDVPSDNIIRLLYGSLIKLDGVSQEPGPGLAESWSVGPDQKTWTF